MIVPHPNFSIVYHSNEQRKEIEDFIRKVEGHTPTLQFKTSGSTGEPKYIEHSKSAIEISANKTIGYFQLKENESAALCLSVKHIAGAMMVIRSMIAGLTLHVLPVSKTAVDFIEAKMNFLALVPMQLQHALKSPTGISNLKKSEHILIGGAPISTLLNQKLINEKISVYHSYGMTETITHIALKKTGYLGNDHYKTLEGISISAENDVLHIDYPEIINKKIITNDRIELLSNSSFRWLGRVDFVINSAGYKISPEILEEKINTIFKSECIATGIEDDTFGEVIGLIFKGKAPENINKKRFSKILHPYEIPKLFTELETFSTTQNGKLDRKKTALKTKDCVWKKIL